MDEGNTQLAVYKKNTSEKNTRSSGSGSARIDGALQFQQKSLSGAAEPQATDDQATSVSGASALPAQPVQIW